MSGYLAGGEVFHPDFRPEDIRAFSGNGQTEVAALCSVALDAVKTVENLANFIVRHSGTRVGDINSTIGNNDQGSQGKMKRN